MKEYLLLLRGGTPAANKTEKQFEIEKQAWGTYMGDLAQKGQLAGGAPLVAGGTVLSPKGSSSEPVTSSSEGIVGGYLLVKATDMAQANTIAKACPHIAFGGNIEVREIAPMPA